MNEHFTILLKENESTNLKLLTEKLNDGFFVTDTITVGRSTVITLKRHSRTRENSIMSSAIYEGEMQESSNSESITIPF